MTSRTVPIVSRNRFSSISTRQAKSSASAAAALRARLRAPDLECFDGGHGAKSYPIEPRGLGSTSQRAHRAAAEVDGAPSFANPDPLVENTAPAVPLQIEPPMNLHEYQSKALFAEYGIPVPQGVAVKTRRRGEGRRREARRPPLGRQGAGARGRPRQGRRREAREVAGGSRAAREGAARHAPRDASERPRGFARRLGLRRVRLEHRARAVPEPRRRPQRRADRDHGVGGRRHGHRAGRARHAREDLHAHAASGRGRRGLPGAQARLRARAQRRAAGASSATSCASSRSSSASATRAWSRSTR